MIRTSVSIDSKRLSDNDFTSLRLEQKISGHHTFEIHLNQKVEPKMLLAKTKAWIGKSVSIGFDHHADVDIDARPVPDVFKGIITNLELSRKNRLGELVVKGYSPTIAMDDGPSTTSFSNAKLEEIVSSAIRPYEKAFPSSPGIFPKSSTSIDYSVQYKESNFDYVNRLASRFGEWFYYDGLHLQFGKRHTGDDPIDLDFDENGLVSFDLNVTALPSNIEVSAYDYKVGKFFSYESPGSFKSDEVSNEAFQISTKEIFPETPSLHIQTQMSEANLKEFASRREEIAADEMLILSGESKNCKLKPAAEICITDKYIGEEYGGFFITSVVHSISQGGDYINFFEAVPAEMDLAPIVHHPEPPFCETQLATVVDTNDEDSLGRVKVEFTWQKGKSLVSPWMRVATHYSGPEKGFYVIPEVDDQVLVAFENNNAEKPYVLTGFYNKNTPPQWFDSENNIKGFKTKGKNEWKFDDKNQKIEIKAVNEILMQAGNKITLKTNGEDGSEIFIDVGEGTINLIAKDVNVTSAENVTVSGGKNIEITAGDEMGVASGSDMSIEGGGNLELTGGTDTNISAGKKLESTATTISSTAQAVADLSAKKVSVNGDVAVMVKAKVIKLN